MTQNRKLVAVTGGIGSGKSTATNIIKDMGFPVFSCDEVCKRLYGTGKVKRKIKGLFPSAVSGKIFLTVDKKEVAKLCFSDSEKYKLLTDYLTELTFNATMNLAKKQSGTVFIEVPLLFEFNKQSEFDKVLVIKRALPKRIESVKIRSNLSDEQIKERIAKQFDYEESDLSAYNVIENDGDLSELRKKVERFIREL